MKKKYLFVGGCLDGRWLETDGQPEHRALVPHNARTMRVRCYDPEMTVDVHIYLLTHRRDGDGDLSVYVYREMKSLLRTLVNGYRGGEQQLLKEEHLMDLFCRVIPYLEMAPRDLVKSMREALLAHERERGRPEEDE